MAAQTPDEKTFRAYTPSDAKRYAQHRQQYSDALYQSIYNYHTSTGGKLDTVVDLGCGPGMATFKLAETFKTTIGLDPSEGMISAARSLVPAQAPAGSVVRFEVSTAEDISPDLIPDGSVDLITAATCAHWFNHTLFYPTAARLLAPNGTLAMFTSRASGVHRTTPNAAAINAAWRAIESEELAPFFEPGNLLARDMYATLPLPWTIAPPPPPPPSSSSSSSPEPLLFPQRLFVRKTFGTDDAEAEGQVDGEPFHADEADRWVDLGTVEKMLATVSPVARWREANADKVGTEEDVVRRMIRIVENLMHEAGVENGKEMVRPDRAGVLLMLKKEA